MARTASKVTLTPDQLVAVDILAAGGTTEDVVEDVFEQRMCSGRIMGVDCENVDRETVRAWLRDADFVASLNVRTNEVRDTQIARLRSLVPAALDTLEKLVGDPDPAVRLRAATYVLKATGVEGVQWLRIDATTPSNVRAGWEHKERLDALLAF